MISSSALISLLVWVIVVGLVCYLCWWLIGYVGLPEPANKIARVLIAIIAVLLLINALLSLTGHAFLR